MTEWRFDKWTVDKIEKMINAEIKTAEEAHSKWASVPQKTAEEDRFEAICHGRLCGLKSVLKKINSMKKVYM